MKRIGVLTSGGDAPGMNAAIRAVVRTGLSRNISTIGFRRGYNGLLMQSASNQEDFLVLTSREVSGTVHRGGTFLMTARCLAFLEKENQIKAVNNLNSLGIEGLVCIGGDGTYHGAASLKELGFPVIGIPGTIDNDMSYTDYSIGFDTALDTAIENIDRIRDTCGSHERGSLVTVMGRNCGEIALSTALACGAEVVMVPEIPWSLEETAERVKWAAMNGKSSLIMIFAEGAVNSLTSDVAAICAGDERLQGINPAHLSSSSIAQMIEILSGHEVRATVLGYTQRGGNPSAKDRILAGRMGNYAVQLLAEGIHGVAVGVHGEELIHVPIEEAMNSRIDPQKARDMKDLIETMAGV
ncbi:MAG: 6-phosphofructokinase [Parasporobacterium sp.]|nr:6-phosphofructokinase [Parasporobacterium sp.]